MIIKKLPIITLVMIVLINGINSKPQPPNEPGEAPGLGAGEADKPFSEFSEIEVNLNQENRNVVGRDDEVVTGVPAMFTAHDYASGIIQGRMTLAKDEACDSAFSSELLGIVTEMEQNKEASDVLAEKLNAQFKKLVDDNNEKKLCEKNMWCDSDICKPRETGLDGRSFDGESGESAGGGAGGAAGRHGDHHKDNTTTTKPASGGVTFSPHLISVIFYSLISLSLIF